MIPQIAQMEMMASNQNASPEAYKNYLMFGGFGGIPWSVYSHLYGNKRGRQVMNMLSPIHMAMDNPKGLLTGGLPIKPKGGLAQALTGGLSGLLG